MDASVEDRIVVESERAAQSGWAGGTRGSGPGSAALPRPVGRRAHEYLRSLGRCREDRAAQERAQEGVTDGEAARRYRVHRPRRPLFVGQRLRCALLPARPLLLLLHLQAVHRRLRLGSQGNRVGHTMLLRLPCHADPPRSRASGNGRSHVTGHGRMRCPLRWSCESGVGWLDWPCGQNPGRNPEGRRRASSARDDGASANRVPVAGPALCQTDRRRRWNSPNPT